MVVSTETQHLKEKEIQHNSIESSLWSSKLGCMLKCTPFYLANAGASSFRSCLSCKVDIKVTKRSAHFSDVVDGDDTAVS